MHTHTHTHTHTYTSPPTHLLSKKKSPERITTVKWVHIVTTHPSLLKRVTDVFQVHSVALEDALTFPQRPKFEAYETFVQLILRALCVEQGTSRLLDSQISSFLCEGNVLITYCQTPSDLIERIVALMSRKASHVRMNETACFLLFTIIESVISDAFSPLEHFGEVLIDIEQAIVTNPKPHVMRDVHFVKRELTLMRRVMWPTREAVMALEASYSALVKESTKAFLRNAYDHTIQVMNEGWWIESDDDTTCHFVLLRLWCVCMCVSWFSIWWEYVVPLSLVLSPFLLSCWPFLFEKKNNKRWMISSLW